MTFASGEIDIVARDGDVLAIVEVKTRRASSWAEPAESVTAEKRRRLVRLADLYLQRHRGEAISCRFDIVEVVLRPWRPAKVRHLRDAFRA